MNIIAQIGNLCATLFTLWLIFEEAPTASEAWPVVPFLLLAILNIFELRKKPQTGFFKGSIVGLYLQRKALEEKAKIARLTENKN